MLDEKKKSAYFLLNGRPLLSFCRYGPSQQQPRGHEESRDWLRSHSTSGLQESASNSPFSPGSSLTSPSGSRFTFGQMGRWPRPPLLPLPRWWSSHWFASICGCFFFFIPLEKLLAQLQLLRSAWPACATTVWPIRTPPSTPAETADWGTRACHWTRRAEPWAGRAPSGTASRKVGWRALMDEWWLGGWMHGWMDGWM